MIMFLKFCKFQNSNRLLGRRRGQQFKMVELEKKLEVSLKKYHLLEIYLNGEKDGIQVGI